MRILADSYRGVTQLVMLNTDRFLTPLLIVAALTLAGWVLSLTQPF
ncbi:hypothetical protein [Hasllibacter sp. MH4015]|nr:hypothetical protein [Hasllibacter sp. MH4015]